MKKYNSKNALSRVWAMLLIVGVLAAMVGCSFATSPSQTEQDQHTAVSDSNITDTSDEEIVVGVDLQAEWDKAVKAEKTLIFNWFTSDIATVETLKRLCEPQIENFVSKSWCIGGSDQLPEYNFNRFVELLELINSYYITLKNTDVSDVSSEDYEEFEKIIEGLRTELGIIVTDNNLTFENIPTFENEFPELMNNTSVITNEEYGVTVITNCNLIQTDDWYSYNLNCNDEIYKYEFQFDAAYKERLKQCDYFTFDILIVSRHCDYISDLTKNGEPVDTIDYTTEEIFLLLEPVFEADEEAYKEFQSVCNEYGFDITNHTDSNNYQSLPLKGKP